MRNKILALKMIKKILIQIWKTIIGAYDAHLLLLIAYFIPSYKMLFVFFAVKQYIWFNLIYLSARKELKNNGIKEFRIIHYFLCGLIGALFAKREYKAKILLSHNYRKIQ